VLEVKRILSPDRLLRIAFGTEKLKKDFYRLLSLQKTGEVLPSESFLKQIDKVEIPKGSFNHICIFQKGYPEQLYQLSDPPPVIFYKGNSELLHVSHQQLISIVGSRHATHEAIELTKKWSTYFVQAGMIVVSGLAFGVDAAAHVGALKKRSGESTIAVLASGIDRCYPAAHLHLYNSIVENDGLIVSEYPLSNPPHKFNFLARNRIIAALSKTTIIIQAKKRSGALVTARLASELGRDVAAVPWSVSIDAGVGSNHLIQQGAHCALSHDDVLEYVGLGQTTNTKEDNLLKFHLSELTKIQLHAVSLIQERGKVHADELRAVTGLDAMDFCDLELKELVYLDHFGFVSLSC
jgi:DNA protecting protein DprA